MIRPLWSTYSSPRRMLKILYENFQQVNVGGQLTLAPCSLHNRGHGYACATAPFTFFTRAITAIPATAAITHRTMYSANAM